MNDGVLLMLC